MGKFDDVSANISQFFNEKIEGLELVDRGIKLEYDRQTETLFCIVNFIVSTEPNQTQLEQLISETTAQLECGYYGDDGWFVDVGQNSYYINLVDPNFIKEQPSTVSLKT